MFEAAGSTLGLIYTVAVFNLRKTNKNPLVGLLLEAARAVIMVVAFMLMFVVLGIRSSPVRGDFLLFVMSGIFMFQAHTSAIGAVAGAGSGASGIMKHGPMNTAVVISAGALASLYRTLFACFVILGGYSLFKPLYFEHPVASLGMLILAWANGCAIGLVLLALRPWMPEVVKILTLMIQRVQMIASGKMFLANALPASILVWFDWNPLFHIIDQTRGFVFLNYTPHHSSVMYPVYVTLALVMVGLMGEFVSRQNESASWSAAR
ncbi:ABC transporter permease [Paracoccus sp. S-4012]|uniref:ABC transporter permease n=1 Tax=Paracoccus sp. S-4012 TaxID=2665648 RepID=UPI001E3E73C1|nr:ABC transporter [Paracoccus sp. S-4012]